MAQNTEYLQKGFNILLPPMIEYVVTQIKKTCGKDWKITIQNALYDQRSVPTNGSEEALIGSLDIANCLRLIDRRWGEVFSVCLKEKEYRTYASELMGVRNIVAHCGLQDIDVLTTERALDTMARLCSKFDKEKGKQLRDLFWEVRKQSIGEEAVTQEKNTFEGLPQPESMSKSRKLKSGGLLELVGTDAVQKTVQTKKVTYGGKTTVYPVYRVKLDLLYFNDQNDRIGTWISKYEAENGEHSLTDLSVDIYNGVIEGFIYDSNPEALAKTQKNIAVVGQREPGVTLSDGRIVDGNRRFTSLRRIQREKPDQDVYFETIIMEMDIEDDKKQIKLLELAIQHGEEKKVDYDMIDYSIGTYRDIVKTELITLDEYAASTNETKNEVKKRLEVAVLITEFLEHIKLAEQYYVARDFQVYSLFDEMRQIFKNLDEADEATLKNIAFNNAMLRVEVDQRKFIRDIKSLVKAKEYKEFFEEQKEFNARIENMLENTDIRGKEDIESFAQSNDKLIDEMRMSIERALQKFRAHQLKEKPSANVVKSIDLLMGIDVRLFGKLSSEDREILKNNLDELGKTVEYIKKQL